MTVPIYPPALPRPLRAGFNHTLADARAKTETDSGIPFVRRRTSAAAAAVTMVTDLSRDERAVFEAFWTDGTKSGSLPFLFPDPATDGWPLLAGDGAPLLTAEGAPLLLSAWWLVMFNTQAAPQWTPSGVRARLSFGLLVLP